MNTASLRVRPDANSSPNNLLQSMIAPILSAARNARQRLSRAFRRSTDRFDPSCSASLDVDRLSSLLDVADRADADGNLDQPPPTEEIMTGTQKEIVVYFKQLQRQSRNQVADLGDRLRAQREAIDLPAVNSRLRDIPSRCENEIRRRIADFQSQRKRLDDREQYLESLQQHVTLAHAGKPDPAKRIFRLLMAILIGAGAILIVNQVLPGTIIAAFESTSWAVVITAVYFLVPLLLGILVSRSAAANRYVSKLVRFLGTSLATVFVTILALFAAHLINGLSAGLFSALESAKNMMLTAPLAIGTDILAVAALGIVVLAGLLAFLIGCQTGNYPLNLRVAQRNYFRIADGREYSIKLMRKRVNAVVDSSEAEIRKLLLHLKKQIRQYSQLIETAKRVPSALNDYDIALEDACNILLDRYRTINGRARRTDWPVCFSEHVCFRLENSPESTMAGDEIKYLDEMRRGVANIEDEVAKVAKQLRDLNWRAINELAEGRAQVLPLSTVGNIENRLMSSTNDMPESAVEPLAEHEFRPSSHYA